MKNNTQKTKNPTNPLFFCHVLLDYIENMKFFTQTDKEHIPSRILKLDVSSWFIAQQLFQLNHFTRTSSLLSTLVNPLPHHHHFQLDGLCPLDIQSKKQTHYIPKHENLSCLGMKH